MSSSLAVPPLPHASSSSGPAGGVPSPSLPSPNGSFQLSLPQQTRPTPSPAPAAPSTSPSARRESVSDVKPVLPLLNGAGGSTVASGSGLAPPRLPGPGRAVPSNFYSDAVIDGKTKEERFVTEGLRSSVHLALAVDQLYATHPDLSAFDSADDIIQRLLPYHIFHLPTEDLVPPSSNAKGKGKARARDWDVAALAGETEETEEEETARLKEVISFAKRKRALEKRFKKLKVAEGQHASPTPQAIFLARTSIDQELSEMASARAQTSHAKAMYTYLNERLSYQVQGIPWLEHEHPPPASSVDPYAARPTPASYQPPAPTYAQQTQYASTRPPPPPPPRANAVDLNAPVPLSLPGSTLPRLVALGLISPGASAGGSSENLASSFRVEGQNVCFSITLNKLNQDQMKGLAELLNAVKGAPGQGTAAAAR